MEKEIDCLTDCNAVCCRRGKQLELTPKEVESLRLVGTEILELIPPNLKSAQLFIRMVGSLRIEDYLEKGLGVYLFWSDCGNLDGNECSIYNNNGQRPEVCKDTKPGGITCAHYREIHS